MFSEAGFNLCEDFKGLRVCNFAGGKGKKKYALPWTSLGDVPAFIPPRKLSEDWGVLEGTIPGQFGEIRTKERKHCN